MSDKVQFQTNIPVEIALKYGDGKEVSGQYGNQVMYTLTDDRIMYVPPIVKRRIEELGIGRSQLFTLTKAETKNGTRRTIEWLVATGGPEERATQTTRELNGRQRRNGAASDAVAGNGHARRPSASRDSKGFLVTGQGQFLLQALAAAVDVAATTERYATACGVELQFTSEDVREIGLSIYATGVK